MQESLLARGSNFSITPKYPPKDAYVAAMEEACSRLLPMEAEEFKSDSSFLLRNHCPPANLTSPQRNTGPWKNLGRTSQGWYLQQTRGGHGGYGQTELHRQSLLLTDTSTYRIINKDPTTRLKYTLTNTIRYIKQTGGLSDLSYGKVYPTCAVSPKVLWPPKNAQSWHPLRTTVSSTGSITYGVAKELAIIICPLVGQSPHHLKNTQHFKQHIQKARLEPGDVMTSYDVKALLTSVPVDPTIQRVKQKLPQDPTLPQRTNMSIYNIITLLEFCLKITYFLFQGKYYEQVQGAARGSPISPLIANLFMEEFKVNGP